MQATMDTRNASEQDCSSPAARSNVLCGRKATISLDRASGRVSPAPE
jgi:hypothetical protein